MAEKKKKKGKEKLAESEQSLQLKYAQLKKLKESQEKIVTDKPVPKGEPTAAEKLAAVKRKLSEELKAQEKVTEETTKTIKRPVKFQRKLEEIQKANDLKKEENIKRQKLDSSGESPMEPTTKPQTEATIDTSFKKDFKEKPAELIEPKNVLIKSGEDDISNSQEEYTATENTVFVGDIPDDAEESELERAFAKFGEIQSIS